MPTDSSQSPTFPDPVAAEGLGTFIHQELNQVLTSSNTRQLLSLRSEFSVTVSVRNIERMVSWYVEAFGFTVDRRNDFPDFGTIVITVKGGTESGIRIEFLQDATFTPFVRPNPPSHSSQQFATQLQFFVNDLPSFVERVKLRADIEIAWEMVDIKPLRMKHFFIRDPEGNLLQFTEPY
jgi:catechol 2,3-dioxygenase-like lactoylglutathione lyase family enzyme